MTPFPLEDSALPFPPPGSADSGTAASPASPAAPDASADHPGVRGTASPSRNTGRDGEAPSPGETVSAADAAVSPGSTPLRGQAFRDAVKAEQSRQAAERRRGKGRYPRKAKPFGTPQAGMVRRVLPGGAA